MIEMTPKWMALPQNGAYALVNAEEILYCKSDGNYSTIFLKNGSKCVACRQLKEMESLLPKDFFIRIHHTYIVNLFHVKKYFKGDGGQVELSTGQKLDVSRRKKQDFLDKLIMV